MGTGFFGSLLALAFGAGVTLPAVAQEILPFPPKPSGSIAGPTMQDSTYSPLPALSRLPKDAPNILIVLIDDVGPAQTDTFGGEIHTPTLTRIAEEGIAYNRFHTTAMCSPTRAALLTGRNHHRVASGQITELANDWDGYSGTIPKSSAGEEAVELLEAVAGWPIVEWAGRGGLLGGCVVPLPPCRGTVAIVLEHLGDRGRVRSFRSSA